MPKDQPELKETRPQDIVNVVYTIASVYVACITPIIRCRFGTHGFTGYWMAALLMMVYAEYTRCAEMIQYLPIWVGPIIFQRLTSDRNQLSRYQGYPWVFGWMMNERMARMGEVFI